MNILRYAIKNIFRNPFLSISSIFIITLLVFFVHILLFVLFTSDKFIASINDRISFTINVRDGYDSGDPRVGWMVKEIRSAFSGISLTYISREDALTILAERDPDLASLVESTEDNPLPNSLRITNVELTSYDTLNNYIARYQDILQYDADDMNQKLLDYKAQYQRVTIIVSLLENLQFGVSILLGLFLFTVAAIIFMIIQNFIHFLHNEIQIIELVGGSSSYIYWPFVIQGGVYAGASTFISIVIVILLKSFVDIEFVSGPLTNVVAEFYAFFLSQSWIILLTFSFIWAISAWIASKKYIHSTIGD
jgi:cell division transport system permease protein